MGRPAVATRPVFGGLGRIEFDPEVIDRTRLAFVLDHDELDRRVVDDEVGVSRPVLHGGDTEELRVEVDGCVDIPSADLIPPALARRPLIADPEVDHLAALFRVLASDTRLRILHAIARAGEAAVREIAEVVDASPQTVSNHLQRMVDQQIVATRRDGNRIYHRLIDPCVGGLIELGLCLLGNGVECDD